MSVVAIIPARGGSRGIPRKNLLQLCGRPLITWSIEQARRAQAIDHVFVSSDSAEILEVAERAGARPICRPDELAGAEASSESAWLHALELIEAQQRQVELVVGLQATSPIREATDLDTAITQFRHDHLDSLFTACEVRDHFMWRRENGGAEPLNHDYRARPRRQDIEPAYIENGSFYLFSPALLKRTGCRLGGRIGVFVMPQYKMFQIDEPADVALCEAILRGYGLVG